jgi:hypothetical protein
MTAKKSRATQKTEAEARLKAISEKKEQAERDKVLLEFMKLQRETDALLWQAVDSFSRAVLKTITAGAPDIASQKVRARVPTAITISYDDGWTFHTKRRLGGLQARPIILAFEHGDPNVVGSIQQAIEYSVGEVDGVKAYDLDEKDDGE